MAAAGRSEDMTFEEFRPALLLLARTQLGTRFRRVVDDSDIVQQTLLDAHRHEKQCRGKTTVERFAWVRQILTTTVLDAVRRHTRISAILKEKWVGKK